MSEEIKHPEAELNDAELANVSGAGDQDDYLIRLAKTICNVCAEKRKNRICSGNRVLLRDYMRKHGQISDFSACPYLKDVPKGLDPYAVG